MKRIFILSFILLIHTTTGSPYPEPVLPLGVAVVPGSSCSQDSDCLVANAICWPTTGNTRGESRCACDFGLTWNEQLNTCTNTTHRNITTVTRDRLLYSEQWLERATPHTFPSTWKCDDQSRYCWASEDNVLFVSTDPRDWWQIRYSVASVTRIRFSNLIWACNSTRPSYLSDNGATTSVYGSGLRTASDHCSTCSPTGHWCGSHGTCNGDWTCRCMDGWNGTRCEIPPPAIQNAARASVGGYVDTIACNPLGPIRCGIHEECMFNLSSPSKGVCVCASGYIRSPLSGTTTSVTSPSGGGVIVTKIPQLCVNATAISRYIGAPVDTPGVGVADVYFLPEDPYSFWWYDSDGTRHCARSDVPVDVNDPTWYPRRFIQRTFICAQTSRYHLPPMTDDIFAAGVCRGRVDACGIGVRSTSLPTAGTCNCTTNTRVNEITKKCDLCRDGFVGPLCQTNHNDCAIDRCSGAGTCLAGPYEYSLRAAEEHRLTGSIYSTRGAITSIGTRPPCICNNRALLSPPDNCTICSYLLRTIDNELIISPSPIVSSEIDTTASVNECTCTPGFGGRACQFSPDVCTDVYCGTGVGVCTNTPAGTECKCRTDTKERFFGDRCIDSSTECRQRRCSGHGECILQDQGCSCDTWWGGSDCSVHQCANGQPFNNATGVCECRPSFYGSACQFWTCNRDSYLVDGKCICHGQWMTDGNNNCTRSHCGVHGEPFPSIPNSCNCNSYADFSTVAPYCHPRCVGESRSASDGNCTCVFGTSGPACDVPHSDFVFPYGTVSVFAVVVTALIGGIGIMFIAHTLV